MTSASETPSHTSCLCARSVEIRAIVARPSAAIKTASAGNRSSRFTSSGERRTQTSDPAPRARASTAAQARRAARAKARKPPIASAPSIGAMRSTTLTTTRIRNVRGPVDERMLQRVRTERQQRDDQHARARRARGCRCAACRRVRPASARTDRARRPASDRRRGSRSRARASTRVDHVGCRSACEQRLARVRRRRAHGGRRRCTAALDRRETARRARSTLPASPAFRACATAGRAPAAARHRLRLAPATVASANIASSTVSSSMLPRRKQIRARIADVADERVLADDERRRQRRTAADEIFVATAFAEEPQVGVVERGEHQRAQAARRGIASIGADAMAAAQIVAQRSQSRLRRRQAAADASEAVGDGEQHDVRRDRSRRGARRCALVAAGRVRFWRLLPRGHSAIDDARQADVDFVPIVQAAVNRRSGAR